ncbi:MAG: HNH endonuclease signature motif containing protein [Chloroflexota bacterium]
MSRQYISKSLRASVSREAKYRCGYCLTLAKIIGTPMEIDHIIPEALGGLTDEDNLWLACSLCNKFKADRLTAFDPVTAQMVRLFNPRTQRWQEHFRWNRDAIHIIGLTPTGRATQIALKLNRASLVEARSLWASVGWHPPAD